MQVIQLFPRYFGNNDNEAIKVLGVILFATLVEVVQEVVEP